MSALELLANALNAASILLAGRNSLHTWWTGIAGCTLFGWIFFEAKLYADASLQAFFIASSIAGYLRWRGGAQRPERPVTHVGLRHGVLTTAGFTAAALLHAMLLHRFTDAAAPVPDSLVLGFSVLGQLWLVYRRVESWWCWILVNSIAVPLFASRGLHLTAVLYLGFWINAWISLVHWQRLATRGETVAAPA